MKKHSNIQKWGSQNLIDFLLSLAERYIQIQSFDICPAKARVKKKSKVIYHVIGTEQKIEVSKEYHIKKNTEESFNLILNCGWNVHILELYQYSREEVSTVLTDFFNLQKTEETLRKTAITKFIQKYL